VLPDLRGFFAFAVWSATRGQLVLVRDRLGKKPLFYAIDADRLVFASEVRALLASGYVARRVDAQALARYVAVGSVPGPNTLVAGVRSLPPGCLLRAEARAIGSPEQWWAPPVVAESPSRPPRQEVVDQLDDHLAASVRDRLLSDVPVGAFLSGGLDSP